MSSSDGLKVVGISGMVATDIDDLVVATVIPGLGKDMADVQVRISAFHYYMGIIIFFDLLTSFLNDLFNFQNV